MGNNLSLALADALQTLLPKEWEAAWRRGNVDEIWPLFVEMLLAGEVTASTVEKLKVVDIPSELWRFLVPKARWLRDRRAILLEDMYPSSHMKKDAFAKIQKIRKMSLSQREQLVAGLANDKLKAKSQILVDGSLSKKERSRRLEAMEATRLTETVPKRTLRMLVKSHISSRRASACKSAIKIPPRQIGKPIHDSEHESVFQNVDNGQLLTCVRFSLNNEVVSKYRTGAPGRPGSRHLVQRECSRRIDASSLESSITEQGRVLAKWLVEKHPNTTPMKPRSVENAIREVWGKVKR